MVKSTSAFEGSNNVRRLNKSSVNVAASSSAATVDATKTFARTVPFTAEDIGFVTVDPSLMTAEKSGVTFDITDSLDQRSTNLNGDPTFFADTPKGGTNSAVDVIPVVNGSNNGLMSPTMLNRLNDLALVRNGAKTLTADFRLTMANHLSSWIDGTKSSRAPFVFPSSPAQSWNPWMAAKNVSSWCSIGNLGDAFYIDIFADSQTENSSTNQFSLGLSGASTRLAFSASKVYNAIWNDYAELFERGSKTEPGDIVMLDIDSDKEQYCIAKRNSGPVIGVHSDTYAHLIGGEKVPDGQDTDHYAYNAPKFIPIGLAGRVNVKVTGNVKKGQRLCLSETPGVARSAINGFDDSYMVGIALEDHVGNDIDRIKMFIKL